MTGRAAGVLEGFLEATAVVVAEIDLVVLPLGQGDPFLGEHVAEEFEVDLLVIDQDAVEVEDDRADHGWGSGRGESGPSKRIMIANRGTAASGVDGRDPASRSSSTGLESVLGVTPLALSPERWPIPEAVGPTSVGPEVQESQEYPARLKSDLRLPVTPTASLRCLIHEPAEAVRFEPDSGGQPPPAGTTGRQPGAAVPPGQTGRHSRIRG